MRTILSSLVNRLGRFLDSPPSRPVAGKDSGSLALGRFSALTRP
jgi:hypothetical protein